MQNFNVPEYEVVRFDDADVITTSGDCFDDCSSNQSCTTVCASVCQYDRCNTNINSAS